METVEKKQHLSGKWTVILASLLGCTVGAAAGLLGEAAVGLEGIFFNLSGLGLLAGFLAGCVKMMNCGRKE